VAIGGSSHNADGTALPPSWVKMDDKRVDKLIAEIKEKLGMEKLQAIANTYGYIDDIIDEVGRRMWGKTQLDDEEQEAICELLYELAKPSGEV